VDYEGGKVISDQGHVLYTEPLIIDPDWAWYEIPYPNVTFSPDGTMAVFSGVSFFGGEGAFTIVNAATQEVVYRWDGKMLNLHGDALKFSAYGTVLVTLFDATLWFWSTADWSLIERFPYGWSAIGQVSECDLWDISPDGSMFAAPAEDTIMVREIANRSTVRSIALPDGMSYCTLSFSEDGKYIQFLTRDIETWQCGDTWQTYDIATGEYAGTRDLEPMPSIPLIQADISRWSSSLPGELIAEQSPLIDAYGDQVGPGYSVGEDKHHLEVRTAASGVEVFSMDWSGYHMGINGIDQDNHLMFYETWATPNDPIGSYIYDYEAGRNIIDWKGYWGGLSVFSNDGTLAAFFLSNRQTSYVGNAILIVYNMKQQALVRQNEMDARNMGGFSPDGSQLVYSVNGKTLEIMSMASPFKTQHIIIESPLVFRVKSVLFLDNTLLAAAVETDRGDAVWLIDSRDGSIVHELIPFLNDYVVKIKPSNDGSFLQIGSAGGWYSLWGIYP